MKVEFEKIGLNYVNQFPVKVFYEGRVVGSYFADFLVEGKVVVELKAIRELSVNDGKQLLNYLRATDKDVGLLLNFGGRAEVKRKIYEKARRRE